MPTYIDESGDTGTHPASSPHFRLAAVWFETTTDADRFAAELDTLRAALRMAAREEFHFVHTSPAHRTAFLQLVAAHPLRYAVCSVAKGDVRASLPKEALVRAAVRGLTVTLREWYELAEACRHQPQPEVPVPLNEVVRYDEGNDHLYQRVLADEFRALRSLVRPEAAMVKKVKSDRSRSSPWLQTADMVCGAVGRHLDGEREYRRLIRGREMAVLELVWNGEEVVPLGTTSSG